MRNVHRPTGRCGRRFIVSVFGGFLGSFIFYISIRIIDSIPTIVVPLNINYRQRFECNCSRPSLPAHVLHLTNEQQADLCSLYATRRGPHQRIIAISLFGPKENQRFQFGRSLAFLHALINDMNVIYPDNYTLRVYHDDTINVTDVICPLECKHPNVDFCSMKEKLFIPPKIWRFIPAGDPLVDISECHREEWSVSTFVCFLASDES
jgi:hypothetical protein